MRSKFFKSKTGTVAAALATSLILLAGTSQPAYAFETEKGYTYNYDYWSEVEYSPDAYRCEKVYHPVDLGLTDTMGGAEGLFVRDNMIYLADTPGNRIICIVRGEDGELSVQKEIDKVTGSDKAELSGPTDVFVTAQGNMYIADKGNGRIIEIDGNGQTIAEFTRPNDPLFDQSIAFLPDKIVVDDAGRIFCTADNINRGIILYETDGSFAGFFGASKVKYDWTDYIWKKLATKAQRAAMESFVPTEYDNLFRDYKGFIYTCTTNVSKRGLNNGDDEPVRRLNLMGNNILIENGYSNVVGDLWWDDAAGFSGPALITDITAMDDGTYFALDKVRGHIFGYDDQGNMLYAFGGSGNRDGYFIQPAAIDHMGRDLIILDAKDGSLTVMSPTEYGNLIYEALDQYNDGDYVGSGQTWEKVLAQNGNYDLAYIGISRAYNRQGQYKKAMQYSKAKYDLKGYSKAFSHYRREWVEQHIGIIFLVFFLLLFVPVMIDKTKKWKFILDHFDENEGSHDSGEKS